MTYSGYRPIAVFDTRKFCMELYKSIIASEEPKKLVQQWLIQCFSKTQRVLPRYALAEYQLTLQFLYQYRGSEATFNAYRRDCERLLQWSWFVREQSLLTHQRDDIEQFIEFCITPYKRWIGTKTVARFVSKNGQRVPNPQWHPFEATLPKNKVRNGARVEKSDYEFSQKSLKALFAVLGSFYQFLLQENKILLNPIALIRQKSKFIRKDTQSVIRRLSDIQWKAIIECAQQKASEDKRYEREVFILSCLYSLYLRVSELVADAKWRPTMGDFYEDSAQNWWFKTVGKGNKTRQVAVSDAMLEALKHYRVTYLELPSYPLRDEDTPLIGHRNNPRKSLHDVRTLRRLVQSCFDAAIQVLEKTDPKEATSLAQATAHWLRHTGISEDVKVRPREHVRDDAGHSSGAITDQYIDVELFERAKTAKQKPLYKLNNVSST